MNSIQQNFLEAQKTLNDFIADENNFSKIAAAGKLMLAAITNRCQIISYGN